MSEKGDQIQIVKIEGEGVKSVANLLMILIVAFITTIPVAIYAVVAVEAYKDRVDNELALYQQKMAQDMDDLRWSNRQNTYWSEQVSSKLDKTFPPLPDLASHQPSHKRR